MRWIVEVSSLGKTDAQKFCVEAESWQRALQAARAQRGEEGPMSGFSIELLEEGYRAVDPVARVRFVVKRAPDDTPVTTPLAKDASSGVAPSPPSAAPASVLMGSTAAGASAAATSAAASARKSGPPRPADKTSSAPAAPVAPPAPAKSAPPPAEPETPGASPSKLTSAAATPPAVGSPLPGLPPVKVLSAREQDPTDASPLTYREYSFAVPAGTSEEVAADVLRGQLKLVDAHLSSAKMGKLVNLAVFDVEFTGKPPAPVATLTWKDWKGAPVIGYPRRGAAQKQVKPPSSPPPAGAPPSPATTSPSGRPPAPHSSAPPAAAPNPFPLTPSSIPPPFASATPAIPPSPVPQVHGFPAQPAPVAFVPAPAAATFVPQPAPAAFVPQPAPVEPAHASVPPPPAFPSTPPAASVPPPAFASAPPPAFASAPPPAFASAPPPAFASAPPPAGSPPPPPVVPQPSPAAIPGSAATPFAVPPPTAFFEMPAPSADASGMPRRPSSPDGMVRTPSGRFVRGRTTGDELITALFESMHDLHFLRDALDGGQFCLALATEVLPARAALIHFFDVEKREWVIACTRGKDTSRLLTMRTPENDEFLRGAARLRRAIVTPDASDTSAQRYQTLGGTRSMIIAPIMQAGRALGAIEIINPLDGMPFTDDEGNAMTYIAEQYAEYLGSRGIVLDRDRIQAAATPR